MNHFSYSQSGGNESGTVSGASLAINTVGTATAVPRGLVGGSTTYNYRVIAENRSGALSAAGPVITATTGPATLGQNTFSITSIARVNGVSTVTTSVATGIEAGAQIKITMAGGNDPSLFDGAHTVATVVDGTHFTFNQYGRDALVSANPPTVTSAGGETLLVAAHIRVKWLHGGFPPMRYWVYRQIGGGAYSLQGSASTEPLFDDYNWGAPLAPLYVPALPPNAPQNGYLVSTVVSGGGTPTLTLANSAIATVSAPSWNNAMHDNSLPLLAAINAAGANFGGTVFFPPNSVAVNPNYYIFNATTVFPNFINGAQITMLLNGGMQVHNPLIFPLTNTPYSMLGQSGTGGPGLFQTGYTFPMAGSSYPLISLLNSNSFEMKNVSMNASNPGQAALLAEPGPGGQGAVNMLFQDDTFAADGSRGAVPILFRGVEFNSMFENVRANSANCPFYGLGSIRGASYSIGNATASLGFTIARFRTLTLAGGGMVFDNDANINFASGMGDLRIDNIFMESVTQSPLRFAPYNNVFAMQQLEINGINSADALIGPTTPLIDIVSVPTQSTSITVRNVEISNNPIFEVGTVEPGGVFLQGNGNINPTGLKGFNGVTSMKPDFIDNLGDSTAWNLKSVLEQNGGVIRLKGGASLFIEGAGATNVVATQQHIAGSVPTGFHYYQVTGNDEAGAETQASLAASVTVTADAGFQSVQVSFTPPPGATSCNIYRDSQRMSLGSNVPCSTSYMDSTAFQVGAPGFPNGQASATGPVRINSTGIVTPQLKVGGGTAASGYRSVSAAITPASVAANTCAEQTFNPAAFAGFSTADNIYINFIGVDTTLTTLKTYRVAASGSIGMTYCNFTAGAVTPAAGTIVVTAWR